MPPKTSYSSQAQAESRCSSIHFRYRIAMFRECTFLSRSLRHCRKSRLRFRSILTESIPANGSWCLPTRFSDKLTRFEMKMSIESCQSYGPVNDLDHVRGIVAEIQNQHQGSLLLFRGQHEIYDEVRAGRSRHGVM